MGSVRGSFERGKNKKDEKKKSKKCNNLKTVNKWGLLAGET